MPADRRELKLVLLERALLRARAANDVGERLQNMTGVANGWYELGELEKARKLLAEALPVANHSLAKGDIHRGYFAASLARFDLPSAMAIAKEFSAERSVGFLGVMAIQLAATNPTEAERLWNGVTDPFLSENLEVCWRLASSDPVRARRIAARAAGRGDASYYIVLAHGLAPRDKAAAREALQQGLDQVDQLMDDPQINLRRGTFLYLALQAVDQIDPALAADIFWRYLAMRPSSISPRIARGPSTGGLIRSVAMYDREVARILFEPIRVRMARAEVRVLAEMQREFEAWTVLDPAGAIAAVERLPINPDRVDQTNSNRFYVALALTYRERWRSPLLEGPLDFLPQP